MKKLLPYITGLSASMIFGFSFLFTKTAIDFVTPFHFLAYRFSFAFAFLSFLKAVGLLKTKISVKSLKDLGFLAFVQPLLYFSLEITGINLTTSMEAGIIISTIPVFVLILSRIFLKEFLNTLQLFSMFLSMAGVLLITLSRGLSFSRNLAGVLFLVACSFSAAIYNILSRKASTKYTAADITYHMMLFGFVGFGTIAFLGSLINGEVSLFLQGLAIKEVLISALYLGVLSS
ncbi:MAG: EamA/RhaT family transporter, partial [Thermotogae bacterium]